VQLRRTLQLQLLQGGALLVKMVFEKGEKARTRAITMMTPTGMNQ